MLMLIRCASNLQQFVNRFDVGLKTRGYNKRTIRSKSWHSFLTHGCLDNNCVTHGAFRDSTVKPVDKRVVEAIMQ